MSDQPTTTAAGRYMTDTSLTCGCVVRNGSLLACSLHQPAPPTGPAGAVPSTTLPTCVCGHVKAHHPLHLGAYQAACTWRGCGCPSFVQEG